MNGRKKLLGALILLGIAGAVLWSRANRFSIPDDPDELTLYSLDASHLKSAREEWVVPKDKEILYDCHVLGKVVIADPEQRRAIIAAVKEDMRSGHQQQAKCFYPRHLLRIVKGGQSVDVVICFECHNFMRYRDGVTRDNLTPSMGEGSKPLLNQLLGDAGIPVAPPAF